MNQNEPLYIFWDGQSILAPTVTDSQVLEFLALQSERGMAYHYVNVIGIREYMREYRQISERLSKIRSLTGRSAILIKTFRPGSLRGQSIARFLFRLWLVLYQKDRKIFVHARGHSAAEYVLPLKKNFPKLRVLFDVRGDLAGEYEFSQRHRPNLDESTLATEVEFIVKRERRLLESADAVSTVSSYLKDALIRRHALPTSHKFFIFPSAASSARFTYDPELRDRTREKLDIKQRWVLVYCGGVGMWHETDRLIALFETIRSIQPKAYFLFLTPHVREAESYFAHIKTESDSYRVMSAAHDQIPAFLNAADAAALLRRQDPLNRVSSPTKFSEYVLTGLPVIISENIGDCTDFVKKHCCGMVLRENDSPQELRDRINSLVASTFDRQNIRKAACSAFSKEAFFEHYKKMTVSVLK